ncbi:RNase adapter RapZ [Thiorhodococcus mannitoliphagus]|uniref:RNase adapter RapZ n=1 Tax=Thiorhodococcus mannitoliphagus TaxID=329406 RepID=A0A6P1DML2_9GAMM|nr:RNase adapter RapZ [Thiorhodococcus mannitoliphagus]NEX19159.1 RNase adapter RapZ [Thiorhodococcus mannitoliphagus]
MKLVILSGLSGSGKSVALHTLEDLGFYCIDNLPIFLLRELIKGLERKVDDQALSSTAVGIDARTSPDDLGQLPQLIREARTSRVDCQVLFLETDTETLIRRFSETRRKHPLTRGDRSLREAIQLDQELLEPIRQCADVLIDTTETNVHELRDRVRGWLVGSASPKASILLKSFGFKHGVPIDVDFVFDVRCLPNPHWQPELRMLSGRDAEVASFLEASPDVIRMRDDMTTFFEHWIPSFETDGRSYLTIAIGCTGGQHRSVYMTEALGRHFEALGHKVMVRHRELS